MELSFPYAANDGTLQTDQFERSAVVQSLMLGQSSVSTADKILFQKCSNSESDCEVLHIRKEEFGDNKSVSPSRKNDLGLKFQKDGKNVCPFHSGRNVVAVNFESSFSKQDIERAQPSDFEVKRAVDTNQNQFSIGLTGREKTVKYMREMSCSSSPNELRASDDQRSLEFEYHELCSLVFKQQRVSRK